MKNFHFSRVSKNSKFENKNFKSDTLQSAQGAAKESVENIFRRSARLRTGGGVVVIGEYSPPMEKADGDPLWNC